VPAQRLIDSDAPRRVTWMELFFDLVFVALVAQVGTPLATDYSFHELTRYALLLLVIWWAWNGYAVYATRFDNDDTPQRLMTCVQMIAVIFMAANAEEALDSVSSAGFAAAYALMRLVLVLQYVRAARIPAARRLAREYAAGFGLAALIWLASSLTPVPIRYGLWTIALAIDLGTALVTARHTRHLPPHAEHLPERFGLFTLILLGESIVAIMKGIQAQPDWTPSAAGAALLGIGLIFTCWWAYFEWAQAATTRRISSEREARQFEIWNYAHLPLYLGLALTAVGVEHIVKLGGIASLHLEEMALLGGAVATVVMALIVLAGTADRVRSLEGGLHGRRSDPAPVGHAASHDPYPARGD
jgi:low temperature requirement protein LtrA